METTDIIRHIPKNRIGYEPRSVSRSLLTVYDLGIYRKLERIPSKISAYFHRKKIRSVFKSDYAKRDIDNYYLVLTNDNTIFHIEY